MKASEDGGFVKWVLPDLVKKPMAGQCNETKVYLLRSKALKGFIQLLLLSTMGFVIGFARTDGTTKD